MKWFVFNFKILKKSNAAFLSRRPSSAALSKEIAFIDLFFIDISAPKLIYSVFRNGVRLNLQAKNAHKFTDVLGDLNMSPESEDLRRIL